MTKELKAYLDALEANGIHLNLAENATIEDIKEALKLVRELKAMQKNEWGVEPGTQDNILPETAPMLSELECDLINLFRAFPVDEQKKIVSGLLADRLAKMK